MKLLSVTALSLLLAAAGCNHPTEVDVNSSDSTPETLVNVSPVVVRDTSTYQNDLDSSAVTPDDQTRFAGFLLVTRTTFDDGTPLVSRVVAKAVFNDLRRPLEVRGKTFGYWGVNIRPLLDSPLTINGVALLPAVHTLRVAGLPVPFGTEFRRELDFTRARADTVYTWHAATDSIGVIEASIQGPGGLAVHSPAGGSTISRDQDLRLKWDGSGKVTIYLSVIDPFSKRLRPVLTFSPLQNTGRALVPAKVLRTLPPREQSCVLTFVLANRKEGLPVGTYGQNVLVQAASVYNCYVQIR